MSTRERILPAERIEPSTRTSAGTRAGGALLRDPPTAITDDYHRWFHEQADLLRHRRFDQLDLGNLIEELESMGGRDKRALQSAYRVLIRHLLKWQFRPRRRARSWLVTINTQRREIEAIEEQSPSLRAQGADFMLLAYPRARADAATETSLAKTVFPEACPYSLHALRDSDWFPD